MFSDMGTFFFQIEVTKKVGNPEIKIGKVAFVSRAPLNTRRSDNILTPCSTRGQHCQGLDTF